MKNKVYVLIKCEAITVWEDSYCDVEYEYNGDPEVIGVFKSKEELIKKLKEIEFRDFDIKDFLNHKEFCKENYFYYLDEAELN